MQNVALINYGSGNLRSAEKALVKAADGRARIVVTDDPAVVAAADRVVLPGVGAFAACMAALEARPGLVEGMTEAVRGKGAPFLGVCVGMQVMFDGSSEPSSAPVPGVGQWPGEVTRLHAEVVPHMGWSTVDVPSGTRLFAGLEDERFYFVHSYAAHGWDLPPGDGAMAAADPLVTWAEHGERFVAAVENGPLAATQFHPEKSGAAGLALLANWVRSLRD